MEASRVVHKVRRWMTMNISMRNERMVKEKATRPGGPRTAPRFVQMWKARSVGRRDGVINSFGCVFAYGPKRRTRIASLRIAEMSRILQKQYLGAGMNARVRHTGLQCDCGAFLKLELGVKELRSSHSLWFGRSSRLGRSIRWEMDTVYLAG
eukprot:51289-Eustigmatos_ZCMA.PRE.1